MARPVGAVGRSAARDLWRRREDALACAGTVPGNEMTPQESIAQAATHVDDAIEYLTFERHDWSVEELYRAAFALLATGGAHMPLPPRGTLPEPGALAAAVTSSTSAAIRDFVEDLEALRRDRRHAENLAAIEALCFRASALVGEVAAETGVLDPGAVYGALAGAHVPAPDRAPGSPGLAGTGAAPPPPLEARADTVRQPTAGIPRRTALKLLGASGVGALAACSRAEPVTPPAASAPPTVAHARIRATTPLDAMQWPTSDPFLFCAYHVDAYPVGNDRMGPEASLAGRSLGRDFDPGAAWRMYHGDVVPGFPRHPHRGFETVTVVRTGMLDHADSMGATARYGGGDVQWLTAGGGIQHAEMFPLLRADADNPLELFQIWLNLPARNKMVPPHFTMLWSEAIPRVRVGDESGRSTEVMVAAGAFEGSRPPAPPPDSWASAEESDLAIWTLQMEPGATFALPAVRAGTERSLYVHRGAGIAVDETPVANMRRVELDGNGPVVLRALDAPAEILLLQARPIGEPVARRGPFVMNTQDEIAQAYSDYRANGFGGWPWQGDAPVHDRSRGRFALRPDGTLEEPT